MNKKTFTLAVIFLICALGWLGANVYWRGGGPPRGEGVP